MTSLSTPKRDPMGQLVLELAKLPGIGERTATRLAYHILKQDQTFAESLSQAILDARTLIRLCTSCYGFTEKTLCFICDDALNRDSSLCVVERPADVTSLERASTHRGLYHVLHGLLSPLDGVGPDQIKIHELLTRLKDPTQSVSEVILALNPSVEGESTALYLAKLLQPLGVRITRLAYGIPIGGTLEFTDRQTLSRALENRVELRA